MVHRDKQSGFTLMEILVATTIFAGTVLLMLGLFTQALQINRRVQGLRQVAQGTRNFTEALTREIRNGRVAYAGGDLSCSADYEADDNQSLLITTQSAETLCFRLMQTGNNGELRVSKKKNVSIIEESINPPGFNIKPGTFRFIVRPTRNPDTGSVPYNGIQPSVTILAEFEVRVNPNEPPVTLPYQTTISTDVYDIPHYQE